MNLKNSIIFTTVAFLLTSIISQMPATKASLFFLFCIIVAIIFVTDYTLKN